MKIIKIVAVLALFLIALALGSQNQELVTFNYLLAKGEFHLSTLLGVVFVVGFALAWVIFGSIQLKTQLQVRRLKKKLKKYEPTDAKKTADKPAIEKQA
ncbi:TPA: LapA family protein [Vibrio diabolicus]